MRRLSPINFFRLIISIFREVQNYLFYRKTIDRLDKDGTLASKGLRVDGLKRVYYVHNMQPEALMYGTDENGDTDKFEKRFVAESMMDKKDIFITNNLFEIVKSDLKRIKTNDYYAYLVWIHFKFTSIKFWNVVYLTLYTLFTIWLVRYSIHNWHYVQDAASWVKAKI